MPLILDGTTGASLIATTAIPASVVLSTPASGTMTNVTSVPAAQLTGTVAVANGGTGGSTSTGTGAVVLGTSPTLTTPALGTPSAIVLTNATGLAAAAMPVGSVLQVVSTTKTDTFSVAGTTYTDVTGLSVAITPASISNKVWVSGFVTLASGDLSYVLLLRGSTAICVGGTAGSRISGIGGAFSTGGHSNGCYCMAFNYLDSPASTSATTYKIQVRSNSGTSAYVNHNVTDSDNANFGRGASSITVAEVKG